MGAEEKAAAEKEARKAKLRAKKIEEGWDGISDRAAGVQDDGYVEGMKERTEDRADATNYEGSNDYLDFVGDRAMETARGHDPQAELEKYLSGNKYTNDTKASKEDAVDPRYTKDWSQPTYVRDAGQYAEGSVAAKKAAAATAAGARPEGYGPGGVPPDTMAQNSYYAREMKKLIGSASGDIADDPKMQAIIDAMTNEALEAHELAQARNAAQAEGMGRYGGGMYQHMSIRSSEEMHEALGMQVATTLVQERARREALAMEGLSQVNQRDLTAQADLTARYGIDSQADSSRYAVDQQRDAQNAALSAQMVSQQNAIAAQMEMAELNQETAFRGQDLNAINSMTQNQQFGMSMAANVGQLLQQNQQHAISMAPGLQQADLMALNVMAGATQGLQNYDLGLQQIQLGYTQSQQGLQGATAAARLQRYMFDHPDMERQRAIEQLAMINAAGGQDLWSQQPNQALGPQPNPVITGVQAGTAVYGAGR